MKKVYEMPADTFLVTVEQPSGEISAEDGMTTDWQAKRGLILAVPPNWFRSQDELQEHVEAEAERAL